MPLPRWKRLSGVRSNCRRLPTPAVTALHQSAVLRAASDLTEDHAVEGYLRKHRDITDTPMQAMWTKARTNCVRFCVLGGHQAAFTRGYVNKFAEASMRCVNAMPTSIHTARQRFSDRFCRSVVW